MNLDWENRLAARPLLPVVTIEDADQAVALADVLLDCGYASCEVVLRTPAALESIERIAANRPELHVGAGTVIRAGQVEEAASAGARFCVSPGFEAGIAAASRKAAMPLVPGVATATEILTALAADFRLLKFFPATASGGPACLQSLAPVFPDVRFCPTGGIRSGNLADWLELECVACVGGSWFVPCSAITAGDWEEIRDLAVSALTAATKIIEKSAS